MTETMRDYLIWSNEHRAWWRPDSQGYTVHTRSAGRYSREQALGICRGARRGWDATRAPDEVPVLAADVEEIMAASKGEAEPRALASEKGETE